MVQYSFAQNSTEGINYKRGVIHVRKKKVKPNNTIQDESQFNISEPISLDRADIEYPPCMDLPWLKSDWKMKGFPNKAFSREYIIDAMHVTDCENVTLFYFIKGDTLKVNSKINFDVDSSKVTFSYLEDEMEKTLKFNYTLDINTKKSNIQPADENRVLYDTLSIEILLEQKKKSIKYRLFYGKNDDPHNYFPGICKEEPNEVHQWISDQIDEDGFRHKIIFRSCSEIEIHYRNPKKKNRKESFKIMEKSDVIYIELSRQRINVSDKFFNSEYSLLMENDKLVMQNKIEKFTYSVFEQ